MNNKNISQKEKKKKKRDLEKLKKEVLEDLEWTMKSIKE